MPHVPYIDFHLAYPLEVRKGLCLSNFILITIWKGQTHELESNTLKTSGSFLLPPARRLHLTHLKNKGCLKS